MKTKNNIEKKAHGRLVISLDFELYWGVYDAFNKSAYADNIRGARQAIPEILKTFETYNIEATWAIVGMLNVKNMKELASFRPMKLPQYTNPDLSAYTHMDHTRIPENEYALYFAPELIQLIKHTPRQEIGSHTFSHYYCLEKGQTLEDFISDAHAFSKVMDAVTGRVGSIVFPRNQVNEDYLSACRKLGINAYRGNEQGWIYKMKGDDRKHIVKRGLRLLDMYINIFGSQSYKMPEAAENAPLNIRGSRQLKSASPKWDWMEERRLQRILKSMTYAAQKGEVYHLWWHPHNFGIHLDRNIMFLKRILRHFDMLKKNYHFESISMGRLASEKLTNSRTSYKHSV